MKTNVAESSLIDCVRLCEEAEKRLIDTREQEALLTSRTPFICDEMCVFLTITTSNDTADETQRPENHASLLSSERYTIEKSIRFDSIKISTVK